MGIFLPNGDLFVLRWEGSFLISQNILKVPGASIWQRELIVSVGRTKNNSLAGRRAYSRGRMDHMQ